MENSEKRVHTRAQYFLLRSEGEQVPLFAFRSADDTDAIPALVVDISEGGVQILSTATARLDRFRYALEWVTGETQDPQPLQRPILKLVWSRPDGMNIRSGFAFESDGTDLATLTAQLARSEHRILRCVLHPQEQMAASPL